MNQHIADRVRFLRAFAANPRQVGAILPTSRYAVRDMLDLGDVPGAGLVVELGAGTGVQTGEILARMRPDARLVALEIDPALARLLEERFDDPRLQVVCDSAEQLEQHLAGERADVLVCALPFTSLEPGLRRRILDSMPKALAPGGVALVIQYSPLIQSELRRLFPSVRRRISPLNVPPAFLFACSPRPEAATDQAV
jgi:phospholipid N-methyltransferase